MLTTEYFKHHTKNEEIFKLWKKGFSFNIEAIKEKLELRRNWVIDDIQSRLENQHRLLLVGVSGTSKSTTLMEIACDYVDKNYWVLYGTDEIRNIETLIKFVEGLLKSNIKVLIAVDNVHRVKNASIFYVIDRLSNYERGDNLRFILTARLPDFDHLERANEISQEYRDSIEKISDKDIFPEFRYPMKSFNKADVRAFIKKYGEPEVLNEFRRFLRFDSANKEPMELSEKELLEIFRFDTQMV